jgi:hypothetical protein
VNPLSGGDKVGVVAGSGNVKGVGEVVLEHGLGRLVKCGFLIG